MMTVLGPTALTSALFISSLFSPNPQTSPSATPLTQVMPVDNYVGHVVEKNETLSFIAEEYYGDKEYWTTIWNDNPLIASPNQIYSDTLLRIRAQKPYKPEELHKDLQEKLAALQGSDEVISETPSLETNQPQNEIYTPASSYDDVYKAAGAKYGVPWQILYGIHMTETGGRNGPIMSGYGSGAEGPMQFMPGTFHAYAVDGDGDGVADINNAIDAIYTAANYLKKHGDLMSGLRSYGGNIAATLALARSRGYGN